MIVNCNSMYYTTKTLSETVRHTNFNSLIMQTTNPREKPDGTEEHAILQIKYFLYNVHKKYAY